MSHESNNDPFCDGVKTWRPDPYQWELYEEKVMIEVCNCVYQEIVWAI